MSEVTDLTQKKADKERKAANASVWGRQDLFADSEKVEEPYFELVDAKIPMRRLTEGEWAEVDSLTSAGTTFESDPNAGGDEGSDEENMQKNMKMKVDVERSVVGERLARQTTVSKTLSVRGEVYTIADIRAMTNVALVAAIAEKVRELSGAENEQLEEIKSVRSDERGGTGSVDEHAGVSTSENADSPDKGTVDISSGGTS